MTETTTPMMRTCQWCAQTISNEALKCPHCRTWRKDIQEDRIKCYVWSFFGSIPGAILGAGWMLEWWHYTVKEGNSTFKVFSLGKFFMSPSGWFVLVVGAVGFCITMRYYIRVSRAIKSWWWV